MHGRTFLVEAYSGVAGAGVEGALRAACATVPGTSYVGMVRVPSDAMTLFLVAGADEAEVQLVLATAGIVADRVVAAETAGIAGAAPGADRGRG